MRLRPPIANDLLQGSKKLSILLLPFEKRLDRYWKKYSIKYNYDKRIEFERQRLDPNYAGTGPKNLTFSKAEDLEVQEL